MMDHGCVRAHALNRHLGAVMRVLFGNGKVMFVKKVIMEVV